MISSEAKHPNCMYMWMDHIISPKANAARRSTSARRPFDAKPCELTAEKDHCTMFHADDEEYFDQVYYWNDTAGRLR